MSATYLIATALVVVISVGFLVWAVRSERRHRRFMAELERRRAENARDL